MLNDPELWLMASQHRKHLPEDFEDLDKKWHGKKTGTKDASRLARAQGMMAKTYAKRAKAGEEDDQQSPEGS
jgi:hypothetical protein